MSSVDPASAVRAAIAAAFAPTAATRLVTLDAADLVASGRVALHAALVTGDRAAPPGSARVDPLRLPLVEGIGDVLVMRDDLGGDPARRLREAWRVLAPAGVLVAVVPLPPGWLVGRMLAGEYRRGRAAGALAAAMFALDGMVFTRAAIVARAVKADGLAPPRRRPVAATRPARA